MFVDDTIAGSWSELVARLDRAEAMAQWAVGEPALRRFERTDQLPVSIGRAVDAGTEDEVVGALVRLAARDGGDDSDAVLVLMHLLSDVVLSLGRQLNDLSDDIVTVVANELAIQIRCYLARGRTRAYVENLRRETRRAVLQECRPWSARRHPEFCEVLVAPDSSLWALDALVGAGHSEDIDVVDLLQWARRDGIVRGDLSLLIATERDRVAYAGHSPDKRVAHEYGIHLATLYRRNARTLAALRLSAQRYLTAVA